jgi:hypothetical protein
MLVRNALVLPDGGDWRAQRADIVITGTPSARSARRARCEAAGVAEA